MMGIIEHLFPSSPPVTYTASSILYPGVNIPSNTVVVGFAKDEQNLNTRIYVEYSRGQDKYFIIYNVCHSSRLARRAGDPQFAATGEEFHLLRDEVDKLCIYLFDETEAVELLRRLDAVFFGKVKGFSNKTAAYLNALEINGCRPVLESATQEETEGQQLRYSANI